MRFGWGWGGYPQRINQLRSNQVVFIRLDLPDSLIHAVIGWGCEFQRDIDHFSRLHSPHKRRRVSAHAIAPDVNQFVIFPSTSSVVLHPPGFGERLTGSQDHTRWNSDVIDENGGHRAGFRSGCLCWRGCLGCRWDGSGGYLLWRHFLDQDCHLVAGISTPIEVIETDHDHSRTFLGRNPGLLDHSRVSRVILSQVQPDRLVIDKKFQPGPFHPFRDIGFNHNLIV